MTTMANGGDDRRELRRLLAEQAERVLADSLTGEVRSAAEAGIFAAEPWKLVAGLALDRVLAAEDEGDGRIWPGDAAPLVLAAGAQAAPLPLPEAILGRWLIRLAGLPQPDGLVSIAPEPWGPGRVLGRVPWGRDADHVVALTEGDRAGCCLVPRAAIRWQHGTNLAAEPRDAGEVADESEVQFQLLPLPADGVRHLGALWRATQIAGAARSLVSLASAYVTERVQFGRPLARFQVIQHQIAKLAESAAAVQAVTSAAWQALDHAGIGRAPARDARLIIAAAKATAGSEVDTLAGIAHQVHGAIGFTAEFPLHRYTRRLWAWRAEFGGPAEWETRLGTLALRRGGDGLWQDLTAVMDAG